MDLIDNSYGLPASTISCQDWLPPYNREEYKELSKTQP